VNLSYTNGLSSSETFGVVAQSPRPEYEHDGDWADQYYIPARMLGVMNQDTCILLPRHHVLQEYVTWFNNAYYNLMYGVDLKVIWLDDSSYLLDDNVDAGVLDQISTWSEGYSSLSIFPYSLTANFVRWFERLNQAGIFGESIDFYEKNANKTILHPGYSSLNLSAVEGLNVPNGRACSDIAEVKDAICKLGDDVMLKEAFGSGGAGIFSYHPGFDFSLLTNFPYLVERKLNLDQALDGSELSLSVQFAGGEVCGLPTRQILHGMHNVGNVIGEELYASYSQEVLRQVDILLPVLEKEGMIGFGGVDFLFENNKPYLVDVNLGRPTACHPAWMFRDNHFQGRTLSNFATLELPFARSINQVWPLVEQSKLNLEVGSDFGVFPLYHLQGMTSRWIAFANSGSDALEMLYTVRDLIS